MRKVAILKGCYSCYDDEYKRIVERITDFEEVDEDTFKLLFNFQGKYNYTLVEQVVNQQQFIVDTVKNAVEYLRKEEARKLKEQEEEKRKKEERALRKKAKNEEQEKVLLAQLIEKYGGSVKVQS